MVRISDILRKMGDGGFEAEKPHPPESKRPVEEKKEQRIEGPPPPPPPVPEKSPLEFRDEVIPTTQFGTESPESLYERLLGFVIAEIFEKIRQEGVILQAKRIQEEIAPILGRLRKGDKSFSHLIFSHSTIDYYLYAHAVNSCILTSQIGISLGYSEEILITLAMGALLHDVGMIQVMEIANKRERLLTEEYQQVKEHTRYSVELLKKIKNIPELCLLIAETAHERYNGMGYPRGLSGDALQEEAQVVALCDVYGALTHPRSYRTRFFPHEALTEILKGKSFFHPRVLKTFIQQVTVYPVGSWIELSTGEQGEVVMTAADYPLRPTIKIFVDRQKKKVAQPRIVDLTRHATLYVKRVLFEKETQF